MLRIYRRTVLTIGITLTFVIVGSLLVTFADDIKFITGWDLTAPLPERLVGGRAMINGDTLYVVGGVSDPWRSASVISAEIENGDTIMGWEEIYASNLPVPLNLHALVTTDDYAYVIGGWDEVNRYAKVWKSDLTTTTRPLLQTWEEVRNYPRRIVLHSAVYADNGRIYVLGGIDDNNKALDQVYFSEVDSSNGNLGPWQETRNLPNYRFRFPAVAHRTGSTDYIYLIGGYDGERAHNEVYYGPIDGDGKIQYWEKTTGLPIPLYYHEAFVYQYKDATSADQARIFVLGGRNDDGFSDKVWSAPINSGGKLGTWDEEARLPLTLHRFAVAITTPSAPDTWRAFVLGGYHNDLSQSQVYRSIPATSTSTPTNTFTPTSTPTNTPVPLTATNTPVPSNTPLPTHTLPPTSTSTPTDTPTHTATSTFTPVYTPTPTVTPTPTPGLKALSLVNQPDGTLAPADIVTYIIDYQNGPTTLTDLVLSNQIPPELELVPGSIQSQPPLVATYSQDPNGDVIQWSSTMSLAGNQQGSVSYRAQRPTLTPMPTATPMQNAVSIVKSGPLTAQPGGLIIYTLTVFNEQTTPITGLTIYDGVPQEAQYVTGGLLGSDNIVRWDVDRLDPGAKISQSVVLTSNQTLFSDFYGVTGSHGVAQGTEPIVTYINELPAGLQLFIINDGPEATWNYNGSADNMIGNPSFNPTWNIYLPLVAR